MRGSLVVHEPFGQDPWGTSPSVLAPDEPAASPEDWQVDVLDVGTVLDPGAGGALRAARWISRQLDHDAKRLAFHVVNAEHDHLGKADQKRAHARRVCLHRGSPNPLGIATTGFSEPLLRVWRTLYTPLRSEAPRTPRPLRLPSSCNAFGQGAGPVDQPVKPMATVPPFTVVPSAGSALK
jgi:hypothetical protein